MSFSTVYQLVDPPRKASSFHLDPNILENWPAISVSEFFRHFSSVDPTYRGRLEEMLHFPLCGDPLQFYSLPHNLWDPHHFLRVCFLLAEGTMNALQAWTFIPRPGFECKLHCEPHDGSGTVEVQVIQQRPGHKIEMYLQLKELGRVLQPPNWLSRDPIVSYEFYNIFDWLNPAPSDFINDTQNPTSGGVPVSPFRSASQGFQDTTARFEGDIASIPLSAINARPVSGFSWLGPLPALDPNAPQTSNPNGVAPQNPQLPKQGASFNRTYSTLDRWLASVPSASKLLPLPSFRQNHTPLAHDRAQDSIIERVVFKAGSSSEAPAENLGGVPAVSDENLVPTEPNSPVLQGTPAGTPDLSRVPTLLGALGPALGARMSHPAGSTNHSHGSQHIDPISTNGTTKPNSAAEPKGSKTTDTNISQAIRASHLQSFSEQRRTEDGTSRKIERFNSLASVSEVDRGQVGSVAEAQSSDVHPPEDTFAAGGGMDVDTQGVESDTTQ